MKKKIDNLISNKLAEFAITIGYKADNKKFNDALDKYSGQILNFLKKHNSL